MAFRRILDFGFLLSARVAGAAFLFLANLLIARFLGLEALAEYAVFISLSSVATVLISLGYPSIAPVIVAEYLATNRLSLVRGFVQTALARTGIVILSLFTGLCLGSLLFNVPKPGTDAVFVIAVLITASATALMQFNAAVLVGMKKQFAALAPETLLRPILFTGFAVAFLSTGFFTDIQPVLWLMACSVWMTLGFVYLRDRKLRQRYKNLKPEHDLARWRKASLPWMGISLLWDFMIDLLVLATSLLAGAAEIAILHICFRYRVLAGFGMRTIYMLAMPEITEQAVTGNRHETQTKIMQVNLASLGYSMLAMIAFYLVGDWLLALFSANINDATQVLLTVSATMLVRALLGPAPLVLAIQNIHLPTLVTGATGLLFALAFIWLFYSQWGIMAAAIAYTGANLISGIVLSVIVYRKTGLNCTIFSLAALREVFATGMKKAAAA